MSRRGVAKFLGFRVEINVSSGYELVLRISMKSGIHPREESCGISRLRTLRCGCQFDHRCNQGGGNAVAGNVGDEESGARVIGENEIVKVSCDGSHRYVAGGDVKLSRARKFGRQNRLLDSPRDFQFLADL